jgi:hypothetical protein
MSFWSRIFASVKPDKGSSTDASASGVSADWKLADCGFCGQRRMECDKSAPYPYTVWRCSCGAIGSGAWLPDLDEVGDQLLEMLGINTRVSEPCVPTDHPAISKQRYDVDKVEHDIVEILKSHDYEFRIKPGRNHNERLFWARRISEKT